VFHDFLFFFFHRRYRLRNRNRSDHHGLALYQSPPGSIGTTQQPTGRFRRKIPQDASFVGLIGNTVDPNRGAWDLGILYVHFPLPHFLENFPEKEVAAASTSQSPTATTPT
jgi:hypothetical protein